MKLPSVHLEFQSGDLWIGIYWTRRSDAWGKSRLELWLCLIPCLPLHLRF